MLRWVWFRFSVLSYQGKFVAIMASLLLLGWALAAIGADDMGGELWRAGIFLLALLLTWLFMRLIWRNYTGRPRR